jgi:hypothetical protein
MIEDPVIQEVRRIRQEHAAQFNYDARAIFADLKRTEEARDQKGSPLLTPPEAQGEEIAHGTARHRAPVALSRGRRR